MSEYTKEEILQMINANEILDGLARSYFWERYDADPEWRTTWLARPNIESIEFDEDEITIECEQRACNRGCCGSDYRSYSFPTSYLWLDQTAILADMKAKAEAEAKAEAARKVKAEEKRAKDKEAADRKKLAELQKQYGGDAA